MNESNGRRPFLLFSAKGSSFRSLSSRWLPPLA